MANQTPEYGFQVAQPLILRLAESSNETVLSLDRLESLLNDFAQVIEPTPVAAGSAGSNASEAKAPRVTITFLADKTQENALRLCTLTDRLSDLLSRL